MSENHISMLVELSDEDKIIEQQLIQQRHKLQEEIQAAINQRKPVNLLIEESTTVGQSLMELKGTIYEGLRLPRNSNELAQVLLSKANRVADIEIRHIENQLDSYREYINKTKKDIEHVISLSIQYGLDQQFPDFNSIIKLWKDKDINFYNETENFKYANNINDIPALSNNIISHYLKEIRAYELKIEEINSRKITETQVNLLIRACELVMSCDDDNSIFQEIFLMGQYAGNLNNIELNINASIAAERSHSKAVSKSNWTHELAHRLYLQYWIYNKYPSIEEILNKINTGEYKYLKKQNKIKDKDKVSYERLEKVIRKKRQFYSKIDPRICLPIKGRPKIK